MKRSLVSLAVAFAIIASAVGLAEADDKKLPRITAVKLAAQYKADREKSDAMYKGKFIVVNGVVDTVDTHPAGNEKYVVFKTNFDLYFVQCFLIENDQNKKLFAKIKPGMKISIKGRVDGGLGSVVMRECEFVRK